VSPKEIIAEAGKLIADPEKWCQGAICRRRSGKPGRSIYSAEKWDAIGAVYYVADTEPHGYRLPHSVAAALAGISAAAYELHQMSTERVNDELGHRAVLEVMRRAWKQANDQDLDQPYLRRNAA
jgi:hypothetical protein